MLASWQQEVSSLAGRGRKEALQLVPRELSQPKLECWRPIGAEFLWGFLKSLAYAKEPQTLMELKAAIHDAVAGIDANVIDRCL